MNSKISRMTEIIEKFSKARDSVLKAAGEKQLDMYKGSSIRLTLHFSSETIKSKRQWDDIYKICKLKKKLSTKNSISRKRKSFKNEG